MDNSYKTAIVRKAISVPMSKLFTEGLLKGKILDFGAGRGYDVDRLHFLHGLNIWGYDPYYAPNMPKGPFDTVTMIYVLNTIPEVITRMNAIQNALAQLKTGGVLYMAIRTDKKALTGWKRNGTWQGDVSESLHARGAGLLHRDRGYSIFFEVKKEPLPMPMCWKCCDRIVEEVADHSRYILIGCKANPDIGSYSDATRKCPLLQEKLEPKA